MLLTFGHIHNPFGRPLLLPLSASLSYCENSSMELNFDNEIINPTFEEWIQHIFDHPVTDPEWHFDLDAEFYDCDGNPHQCIEYMGRLFASPVEHLQSYTDAQINQGLWLLVSEIQPEMYTLFYDHVPLDMRIHVVKSMYTVYEQLFSPRCSPTISSLHRTKEDMIGVNPLNSICYMWWDIIPLYGKSGEANREVLDEYCVDVMEQTLKLKSIACQEGALHGLGHWARAYRDRIKKIIDEFLGRTPNIDDDLREYALAARQGMVL